MKPELKQKAKDEINRIVGKSTNLVEDLTLDKVEELEFLKMCFNESLRIEPPLPMSSS